MYLRDICEAFSYDSQSIVKFLSACPILTAEAAACLKSPSLYSLNFIVSPCSRVVKVVPRGCLYGLILSRRRRGGIVRGEGGRMSEDGEIFPSRSLFRGVGYPTLRHISIPNFRYSYRNCESHRIIRSNLKRHWD